MFLGRMLSAECLSSVLSRWRSAFHQILKAGGVLQESQLQASSWTIALLGDDDLGYAFDLGRNLLAAHVVLLAENESDHVGVLLDRSRFAQIGKLWTLLALATTLGSAAQLRERNHGNAKFLSQRLESARDRGDLLRAILVALAAPTAHQLQIIDDDQIQLAVVLLRQTS